MARWSLAGTALVGIIKCKGSMDMCVSIPTTTTSAHTSTATSLQIALLNRVSYG